MSTETRETFSNSITLILSCLGNVVGTGNVWRFPRIAALNCYENGSLCFVLVWFFLVVFWAMPLLLVELGLGRYIKAGPTETMRRIWGHWGMWCGIWIAGVTYFLAAYYYVVEGWCIYYLIRSIGFDLPKSEAESRAIFTQFAENSDWPVLTMVVAALISGACALGGIKWIEKVNLVLLPTLLIILLITFGWSLSLPYSEQGITNMFGPTWSSLAHPRLWIDAASQIAFDTGAGMGTFLAYASYMKKSDGVVTYSVFLPLGNNIVSLLCGITMFNTVFSTLIVNEPTLSRAGIIEVLRTSGSAGTGITFIWMPLLLSNAGVFGRILCILFFFCLICAAVSSTISGVELSAQTLLDLGFPNRRIAVVIITAATLGFGAASGASIDILRNQDFVWGFGIIVSGLILIIAVTKFGVFQFRKVMVNDYGTNDLYLPWLWAPILQVLVPLEALTLLVWWIYTIISSSPGTWYYLEIESLTTTFLEWFALVCFSVILNIIFVVRINKNGKNHHSAVELGTGSNKNEKMPNVSGSKVNLDDNNISYRNYYNDAYENDFEENIEATKL